MSPALGTMALTSEPTTTQRHCGTDSRKQRGLLARLPFPECVNGEGAKGEGGGVG